MNNKFYNASEVKEAVASQIQDIVKTLFPEAKKEGMEMKIGGLDGSKGRSLGISIRPDKFGAWGDLATDEQGDIISLVMNVLSLSYKDAIQFLAEKYTDCRPQEKQAFEKRSEKPIPNLILEQHTFPLNQEVVDHAYTVRKISLKTLESYKVHAGIRRNEVAFCSWYKKQLVKVHYATLTGKKIFSSTENPLHTLWGKEYATPERCQGKLVITEGQWDALSFAEAGIPAVSIPSGVSNLKWLETDWDYLAQFHTFYLSFDNDDSGEKCLDSVVRRLGVSKCNVIKLPEKDASDVLQKTEKGKEVLQKAYKDSSPHEPPQIVKSSVVIEEAWELNSVDKTKVGDPFFLKGVTFRIRLHEMTLIFGYRSHGKSQLLLNQIAFDLARGIPWMIGSFESMRGAILADVISAYSGIEKFTDKNQFIEIAEKVTDLLFIYDSNEKPTPKEVLDAFEYVHKRYGVERFAIDNVSTVKIPRGDNEAQAQFADDCRLFTKTFPVHLMVVAHPKKSQEPGYEQPPHEGDIRGASEWGDYPENIICAYRNKKKTEVLQEYKDQGMDEHLLQQTADSTECGKIIVRKHRFTGEESHTRFWFEAGIKRFQPSPNEFGGFYKEEKTEQKTETGGLYPE